MTLAYDINASIFGHRVMNWLTTTDYVSWAIEMLEAGYDTRHLRILAGIDTKGSKFEADGYFLSTLYELKISIPDKTTCLRKYACEIARQLLIGHIPSNIGVKLLYQLYLEEFDLELVTWAELDDILDDIESGLFSYPNLNQMSVNEMIKNEARALIERMADKFGS